jgi:hypothetical protein
MAGKQNPQDVGGWVIQWQIARDGGPGAMCYYLAAIADADKALQSVRAAIGGNPKLSLGSPVNRALLERRKLAKGEVIAVKTRRGPSLAEKGRIARAAHSRSANV